MSLRARVRQMRRVFNLFDVVTRMNDDQIDQANSEQQQSSLAHIVFGNLIFCVRKFPVSENMRMLRKAEPRMLRVCFIKASADALPEQ